MVFEYISARSQDVLLAIGGRERKECNALGKRIFLIYSQIQDVKRVDLIADLDRIVVSSAVVIGMSAPFLTVSLTDAVPVGVRVDRMCRLREVHMQHEGRIAPVRRMADVRIITGRNDRLTMPAELLAAHDSEGVFMNDRHAFCEESRDDTVAAVLHARQRVDERLGLRVGLAVPFNAAAERYRTHCTQYRLHRQNQLVDTVLIGYRAVTVVVVSRLANT